MLLFIPYDTYVRQMVMSGALDGVLGPNTYVVGSSEKLRDQRSLDVLRSQPNFLGTVMDPRPEAERSPKTKNGKHYNYFTFDYPFLQQLITVRLSSRSTILKMSADNIQPVGKNRLFRLAALPMVRGLLYRIVMWRTGRHKDIERLIKELKPDLVVLATSGVDSLSLDAIRSARRLRIPSLGVVPNWDALTVGGAFAVRPDYLGVWGRQSVQHAERVHGFDPARVSVLGSPGFEPYFRYDSHGSKPPFAFKYVLFAGGWLPFDELRLVALFDSAIEQSGREVTLVYRPHPDRAKRKRADFVDEERFNHVIIDPQMRDLYNRHFDVYTPGGKRPKGLPPSLDYYPPLLAHAEFVVCMLSTMILEAAFFGRRSLVPVFADGVHRWSPDQVRHAHHFAGLDRIDGIEFCASPEALLDRFTTLLTGNSRPEGPMREQLRYYCHFDEQSYGQRLGSLVQRIVSTHGAGA